MAKTGISGVSILRLSGISATGKAAAARSLKALGDQFEGVLVSDFYSGYNVHDGFHQRCWAHLLRDLKDLVKCFLSARITAMFEAGKQYQSDELNLGQRHQRRRQLENKMLRLVTPYLLRKHHPFHTLAARIDRFLDELFVFVLDKNTPATNNSAERALRHSVIARKISGGTRSETGSRTKEILSSLFGTWEAMGLNPMEECRRILVNPNYAVTKLDQEVYRMSWTTHNRDLTSEKCLYIIKLINTTLRNG